jgi:hypothetical protein
LILLIVKRGSQKMAWVNCAFLMTVIATIFGTCVNQLQFARAGVNFVPFESLKIALVVFAMSAPMVMWVGVLAIFLTLAFGEIAFSFLPAETRVLFMREPWQILIAAGLAFALFWRRLHNYRIRRQLALDRAENATLGKTQQSLMAIRAPLGQSLQSLWRTLAVIEKEFPDLNPFTATLKQCLERLTELQTLISGDERPCQTK